MVPRYISAETSVQSSRVGIALKEGVMYIWSRQVVGVLIRYSMHIRLRRPSYLFLRVDSLVYRNLMLGLYWTISLRPLPSLY